MSLQWAKDEVKMGFSNSQRGIEVQTQYMTFLCIEQKPKTSVWQVLNRKSNFLLGTIRWYPPWRQYVLMPQGDTVFNNRCLTLIMGFMNRLQKGEDKNICFAGQEANSADVEYAG